MSDSFSKEEAVNLLGSTVIFTKTYTKSCGVGDIRYEVIKKGCKSDVVLVECHPETKNITISFLVNGDFLTLNKNEFDDYCLLVALTDEYTFPLFKAEREECLLR